jgi:DNA-binding FadR family transcriptional regulator
VPKAAELIASQLRRQIIDGELRDGEALPNQANLIERFGVSRPTLREALRILESESLLVVTRGSRMAARVTIPSEATAARYVGRLLEYLQVSVVDVHEALMAIELPAIAKMAREATADDLTALEAAANVQIEYSSDWELTVVCADHFHRLLVERAGNRTLSVMRGLLDGIIADSGRDILRAYGDDEAREYALRVEEVHRRVVRLIRGGAAGEAMDLWRRHGRAKLRALEAGGKAFMERQTIVSSL